MAAATAAAQDKGPEPEPTEVPEPTKGPEASETSGATPDASEPVSPETVSPQAQPEAELIEPSDTLPPEPSATPQVEETRDLFTILGQQLEPGELRQFNWQQESATAGLAVPTPVLVAHGHRPGPTLCLVAAVHGDELNGVEIVRRIMFGLNLDRLAGNVVGVPIANAFGFLSRSRYLPDRRDLNRHFPGTVGGSLASRFAYALFNEVIARCDVLVDIHTGSFHRTNLPQLRADLAIGPVLNLTKQFGDIAVLHEMGPMGSLRRAATDQGIAAVTMETGGPGSFEDSAVDAGVQAIEALLNHLGMVRRFRMLGEPQPVFYESTWVRAESGGILLSDVRLGAVVVADQVLGTVTDPIQNTREFLKAPFRGRILGMAVNQVVMPGFAAFHIGRVASEPLAVDPTTREEGFYDGDDFDTDDGLPAEGERFESPASRSDKPAPEQPRGFDPAPVDATLQSFVLDGRAVGVSALVYKDGGEVYFNAFGMQDREGDLPMARDTIVQIFSMTKPVTGVALMQLWEQGKFDLDDPVADYVPELANVKVWAGVNADGAPVLEEPQRPATIRDFTRHTAGLYAEGEEPRELGALMRDANPLAFEHSLSEFAAALGTVPLLYHPGERWLYGMSVDVQAVLVERLSGQPFGQYVRDHILTPLGLDDTGWYVPEAKRARMAVLYWSEDGQPLARRPDAESYRLNFSRWPLTPGGFGVTSTLDDYMRFARMLQNEGELDGVRLLQPETVRLMATDALPDTVGDRSWLPGKGQVGFGIDFAVRIAPPASAEENMGAVGEFFWDGFASTLFWVDPENDLTSVFFVQRAPNDGTLHKDFRDAVYEAIGITYAGEDRQSSQSSRPNAY